MAGATAATAATASTSPPHNVVQINLVNNKLNTFSGDSLNADLTGIGQPTIAFSGVAWANESGVHTAGPQRSFGNRPTGAFAELYIRVKASSTPEEACIGFAKCTNGTSNNRHGNLYEAAVNRNPATVVAGTARQSDTAFLNLTFSDPKFNNDELTNALLEVSAFNSSPGDQTVELTALIFDNEDPNDGLSGVGAGGDYPVIGEVDDGVYTAAVPEPSSIGLLALGAGGVLALRQRRKAR